jgi:hypothetical protein
MAQQTIGVGEVANDGTGDPLRTAFIKTNDNFSDLYTARTRTVLQAELNLYISPFGDDSTGDGSVGTPWRSIQKAFDYLMSSIDMGGLHSVNINMEGGAYDGASLGMVVGCNNTQAIVVLEAPNPVTIEDASLGWCLYCSQATLELHGTGPFTFTGNLPNSVNLWADQTGLIYVISPLVFEAGTVTTNLMHLYAGSGGTIAVNSASISIIGNFEAHMMAENVAFIFKSGGSTTIYGIPTMGAFVQAQQCGVVTVGTGQEFIGGVTGKRYQAVMNGVIEAHGQVLPGSFSGVTATGGQFE